MNTHADRTKEIKSQSVISKNLQKQSASGTNSLFADNRPEVVAQQKLTEMANNSLLSSQAAQLKAIVDNRSGNALQMKSLEEEELLQGKFTTVQKKAPEEEELQMKAAFNSTNENRTGLPDNLKNGIENLSGMSLNDVNVHYNSDKPAQLNALAYAQGTDIHVASGQEKHLPHEAWHVVQQKQGRVKPTMQMKGKVNVNDDKGLEKEADVMGAKALSVATQFKDEPVQRQESDSEVIQKFDAGIGAGWHIHFGEHIKYASNNATRVNFGGRTRQQIGYSLEQKIQENGLASTKADSDFVACKTWIRNNIA